MRDSKQLAVALVGADQQDNLALGYLAAAVGAASFRAQLLGFNDRDDLERCIEEVIPLDPAVIGVAIPFQSAIADSIELIRALRTFGYQGHITCGGHVPTFSFRELLAEVPQLSSVIRHDGEETLVELTRQVIGGGPLAGIHGLVWRDGDQIVVEPPRPLVRRLETLAQPLRRRPLQRVGGLPISFVITSRGCIGDCSYCCIRAFNRDAGGPAYRSRPENDVADEVAAVYHRDDARVFLFQDDLFILPNEQRTLRRLDALTSAFAERGVEDARFWIKSRPESLSEEVVAAAARMGTLHLFLGVESASPRQLRVLGRGHDPNDNERAIRLCKDAGIVPSFNLMLFDPDSTLDDVSLGLDFLSKHVDLPWNICRTEVYPGTPLLEKLRGEGRLEGRYDSYGYRIRDEGAEIMFRILRLSFHQRAFACESLINRLITLSFARQIHDSLFPGPRAQRLADALGHLIHAVRRDTLERLYLVLERARTLHLDDIDGVREFALSQAMEVSVLDSCWATKVEELWRLYDFRGVLLYRQRGLEMLTVPVG